MPVRDGRSRRGDINADNLQRHMANILASAAPSAAGPSRHGDPETSRSRPRSHSHRRPILRAESKDSLKDHEELARLLKDVQERLAAELSRAHDAEQRAREADARTAALKVANRKLENETMTTRETVRAYQTELRTAIAQVETGNEEIQRLARERDAAEESAARARTQARQAAELLAAEAARQEGRREGLEIGRQEGIQLAQSQGWGAQDPAQPDQSAQPTPVEPQPPSQRHSRRRSEGLSPMDDLTSPVRTHRPRRVSADVTEVGTSNARKRASAPVPKPVPLNIPDVAPMARTLPRMTMTTPMADMAEVAKPTPSPAGVPKIKAPTRVRGRVISGPIQMEPPPIVPVPIHNSAEPHVHSPITKLPDTYIPVMDEHSEVPFPLPPPHELGDMPATPSISSRGPLQPTSPTEVQHRANPAAGAAKAFTRGMKSVLKGARRVSAMSGLTLLREPQTVQQAAVPSVMPISPTTESMINRRPALSVIMEGSMPTVPQMPVAYTTSPVEAVSPNRHTSVPAGLDSGLQNWTAQHYAQQQHRQRMASELRNSNPDMASEADFSAPRHQKAESIRSGTSFHDRHRPRVRMPEPLGTSSTVAHLQDQADAMSIGSSRVHSDVRYPQSSRSRTGRSVVSSAGGAGGSQRRKAPPEVRDSMFSPDGSGVGMPAPYGHSIPPHAREHAAQRHIDLSTPPPTHSHSHSRSRSGSGGPSIMITRPRSRSGGPELLGTEAANAAGREIRRSPSAASIGSAASSLRSRRSAYRPFKQEGYVDPSSFAVNIQNNPFAAGTEGAAAFERSRPPSPSTAIGTASNW